MSMFLTVHPLNPQEYLLQKAVNVIRQGGVIVYPTDSGYALACQIGNKQALDRIRSIRHLDLKHHFTLVCRDLSELSTYALVDNQVYRLLRNNTPGPYTFILKATKEVPRRLQHPKRKTIGLRIPNHIIALALLEILDEPLMSSSLTIPDENINFLEAGTIRDILGHQVDLIIDGGNCGLEPTTVIDLSDGHPVIVREGKGDVEPFEGVIA
jgi:tRNA threonylcarbamoyl adenosine modification protein (Sua5/YciO/YrdC/YwlC family)